MPTKPTQFDGKHFATLHTDAERHNYLLDLTEGIRDNLKVGLTIAQTESSFVAPYGFTTAGWIKVLDDQVQTMTVSLRKEGRS